MVLQWVFVGSIFMAVGKVGKTKPTKTKTTRTADREDAVRRPRADRSPDVSRGKHLILGISNLTEGCHVHGRLLREKA